MGKERRVKKGVKCGGGMRGVESVGGGCESAADSSGGSEGRRGDDGGCCWLRWGWDRGRKDIIVVGCGGDEGILSS